MSLGGSTGESGRRPRADPALILVKPRSDHLGHRRRHHPGREADRLLVARQLDGLRLGLAVIAAIYVGFAVSDGRVKIIAVESGVASGFVLVSAAAVTGTPWLLTPHPANSSDSHLRYLVADLSCEHCRLAVTEEVQSVSGVASVDVDLDAKLVIVHGCDIDGEAVIAAIDEAGYDAVFDAAA